MSVTHSGKSPRKDREARYLAKSIHVHDELPMCWWAVGEGDNCPNKATHYEVEYDDDGGNASPKRPTCDDCCGASRLDGERCAR